MTNVPYRKRNTVTYNNGPNQNMNFLAGLNNPNNAMNYQVPSIPP